MLRDCIYQFIEENFALAQERRKVTLAYIKDRSEPVSYTLDASFVDNIVLLQQ